jgi:acyl-CoA synthetase (AMP-forming)/AMP-acid ligase II
MAAKILEAPTMWDLICARADATPSDPMVVDESRQSLTFAQYRDRAEAAAAGLAERGVGEGSVVSWILPTTNHAFVLVGALCRLGAIQNPILPIYREREVGFIARQAKPQLLIVPGTYRGFDFEQMAKQIAADNEGLEVLVCEGPIPSGDASTLPPFKASGDARWIFYTSGSTADPKGAQHTDTTILSVSKGMADRLDLVPQDRNGLVFPFTHIAGPIWLGSGLMVGLCHLIMSAFDPVQTVAFFREQNVTIAGSGTMFHMAYLNAQREQPDERLFPRVRNFPGGGAPKPPQLHYDMKDEMGAPILSGYGLTEAPILTMARASDPDDKLANTEGRPMPGVELKLVTLDGKTAKDGEEGEIRAKAPQMMKGYLDSSLDADAFDEEGFFRTGDLGRLEPSDDGGGYVVITGRVKDIIIRKGENISAKEVEDLLFTHPKVADVAVIGLPDLSSGERACAVVVTKPDADELTMDELKAFLEDKGLRRQAIPEQLELTDALPRNPAGKVLKQDLKKVYA